MTPRFDSYGAVQSSALTSSSLSQTYALTALAMLCTAVGVGIGTIFAPVIINGGLLFILAIVELAIVWTAPSWSRSSPLNIILFILFPVLSGITVTPFLLYTAAAYANGTVILLNASIATTLLCGASALVASMSKKNLAVSFGWLPFQMLIGLIVFGLLQIFIPSLRGTGFEMIISGVGIVTFSLFLTIDIQRLSRRAEGTSPFLMAISLYLDIFNLFLYVVRFMSASSGRRN
jgi:FtsH-binding integral membrane protein